MYSSIYELPTQVRTALDDTDQKVWMDVFNKADAKTEEEVRKAKEDAWKACMELPSSFSFKIVASVEDIDKDKEIIDVDSLKKHMDEFIDHNGNLMAEHKNYCCGHIFAWEPIKKDGMNAILVYGNLFGGNDPVYKSVRESFIKGRNNLSVAGESGMSHFQCDSKGCYTRRFVKSLQEISLCFVPANKHCTLQWKNPNANFAKSASEDADEGGFALDITEVTFHKSYYECPILKLRKALRDAGVDAHAREDGVFVPFTRSQAELRDAGLNATYVDGGMLLKEDDTLRTLFQEGFEKGAVNENGELSELDTEFFAKACSAGAVERSNGVYRLIDPLEAFEKANKATELLGSEGVRLQDENNPPQKGLHMNYGITDTDEAPKLDRFDPDAFQLFHDREGSPGYPEGGYYEGVLMPNKPKGRHTDAQNEYGDGGKYSEKGKGIITELYPDAKVLHVRNMKDWEDLYDRFDTKISDFEYNNDKGKRYIPSQDLVRDYDAIQFDLWPNKEHNDYIDENKLYDERDTLEEKRLEHPNFWDREMHRDDIIYPRTSRANERIIINPYAVMNSYPYDPENVKYESPRTEGYADWDRAKSLEKLKARYEAAGIPVNWEQRIQKSDDYFKRVTSTEGQTLITNVGKDEKALEKRVYYKGRYISVPASMSQDEIDAYLRKLDQQNTVQSENPPTPH